MADDRFVFDNEVVVVYGVVVDELADVVDDECGWMGGRCGKMEESGNK